MIVSTMGATITTRSWGGVKVMLLINLEISRDGCEVKGFVGLMQDLANAMNPFNKMIGRPPDPPYTQQSIANDVGLDDVSALAGVLVKVFFGGVVPDFMKVEEDSPCRCFDTFSSRMQRAYMDMLHELIWARSACQTNPYRCCVHAERVMVNLLDDRRSRLPPQADEEAFLDDLVNNPVVRFSWVT